MFLNKLLIINSEKYFDDKMWSVRLIWGSWNKKIGSLVCLGSSYGWGLFHIFFLWPHFVFLSFSLINTDSKIIVGKIWRAHYTFFTNWKSPFDAIRNEILRFVVVFGGFRHELYLLKDRFGMIDNHTQQVHEEIFRDWFRNLSWWSLSSILNKSARRDLICLANQHAKDKDSCQYFILFRSWVIQTLFKTKTPCKTRCGN